jgi:hypothetical protein
MVIGKLVPILVSPSIAFRIIIIIVDLNMVLKPVILHHSTAIRIEFQN